MLFDLAVLGTGPAGLAAASLAAEMGHRVAIVNDPENFECSEDPARDGKRIPAIRYFSGSAKFQTTESVEITFSRKTQRLDSRRFLLACGNRPKRPSHLPFDGQRILDSDEARRGEPLPRTLLIVGAGEHGLRCASELLERGLRVSLVDQSRNIPSGKSPGGSKLPWERIQAARCPVHWGTTVLGVENRNSVVSVFYDNGSIESFGGVVFAVGRVGCTEHLNLPRPDLLLDETFRVWCDDAGQTGLPHILAVGSVVGFPRFPGSPAEEARHIIEHLFGEAVPPRPAFLRGGSLLTRR